GWRANPGTREVIASARLPLPPARSTTRLMLPAFLPQAPPAPAPAPTSSGPDAQTIFYLTLLFIFLTAIITTVFTKWARDKCLKFFNCYHVTLERIRGQTIWGTLKVFSSGVEVVYDHAFVDARGRKKTSYLIYGLEVEQ